MIKYWYGGLIVGASCQAIHPHTIMATEEIQMQQALKPLSMLVQDSVMSWCPCGGWLYWILSYQKKRERRSKFSYWSGIRKWLRRVLQVKISNSQTSCKQPPKSQRFVRTRIKKQGLFREGVLTHLIFGRYLLHAISDLRILAIENVPHFCIAWFKHERGWENSRQLCKPNTVENSPKPSSVYIRPCKYRKKVFYCFYKLTFLRKNAILFVMALIKKEIQNSRCTKMQFLSYI